MPFGDFLTNPLVLELLLEYFDRVFLKIPKETIGLTVTWFSSCNSPTCSDSSLGSGTT